MTNIQYSDQKKRVFDAFYEAPKTTLQASIETGVLRANITRYVAQFEKEGKIFCTKKAICPITKNKACFYSCNKELWS